MKKKLIITLGVVLVAVIGITIAQTMGGSKKIRLTPEQRAELQTKKMADIYDLTEEQQKKIYPINLDFQKKLQVLNEDKSNTANRKSGENLLREEHEKGVMPILNEGQKKKWNDQKEYRKTHPKEEKK